MEIVVQMGEKIEPLEFFKQRKEMEQNQAGDD